MGYLVVLPFFLLWLLVAGGAVLAGRTMPALAGAYYYIWRIALWATLGTMAALAAMFTVMHTVAAPAGDTVLGAVWQLMMVAGPLIAAALGWCVGALVGIGLSLLHERTMP